MADWSLQYREWMAAPSSLPYDSYQYPKNDPYYGESQGPPPPPPQAQGVPPQAQLYLPPPTSPTYMELQPTPRRLAPTMVPLMPAPAPMPYRPTLSKADNPRLIRNMAEKQRRDKLNQAIAELASLVPPVVSSKRKIDKTGVLRYTAHYLRAHQYVFDPTTAPPAPAFSQSSTQALLEMLNGFLLTTTYKGLIVVLSQNVHDYLGYTELELLGKSVFGIVHEEDRQLFRDQLMPRSQTLGHNGELVVPDEQDGREKVAQALADEKRRFVIRFMKLGQRSEQCKYVTCHVEGSLRLSDRACRGYSRCCQMVRRARARGDNPCSSGNDVVFIGVVRPSIETFINESALESYKMEYRTRHSIDGEIIQCEQRIALVTGYMMNEVSGANAMNFIHRDEVLWVITALEEMYNQKLLFGESCYRLMTKNGQFIYMRTRGRLEVDSPTGTVTSFVCTNTVVEEDEGKEVIKLMKERFSLKVNNNNTSCHIEEVNDTNDSQALAVEDPKKIEKVILNLVTNLPPPEVDPISPHESPVRGLSPHRLAIIPPRKERILSSIEKIYSVIKIIPKPSSTQQERLSIKVAQPPATPTYLEAPEIKPVNDIYFQPQSSSENNSELSYSPATSSDFEYAPCLGISSIYDEMSSLNFGSGVESTQSDMEFQTLSSPTSSVVSNGYQKQLMSDILLPDASTAGVKRPNRFDDQETLNKKQVLDVTIEQTGGNQLTSGRESPTLETYFDEAILNTEIESAIDALEETNFPNFPDLLISNEVEDILGANQSEPD